MIDIFSERDGHMRTEERAATGGDGGRRADPDPRLMLQSVERAFQVLEALGRISRPASLGDIAAETGLDRSAVQRIVHTLTALGYLERGAGGGLIPGVRALDRAFDMLRMQPLIERATPVLIELRRTARERVDLSLFDDLTIVYAVRLQSKRETFFATLIGRRVPTVTSSGGRAMLALMDDAAVDDIIARSPRHALTPKTITDPDAIRGLIGEARASGFAMAVEEALPGEVVVAASVRDAKGGPAGAVHIAGSLSEWSPDDYRDRFAPLVMEAARALSP